MNHLNHKGFGLPLCSKRNGLSGLRNVVPKSYHLNHPGSTFKNSRLQDVHPPTHTSPTPQDTMILLVRNKTEKLTFLTYLRNVSSLLLSNKRKVVQLFSYLFTAYIVSARHCSVLPVFGVSNALNNPMGWAQ